MSLPPRIFTRAWILVLLGTGGFLLWLNAVRVARVDYLSGLAAPELAADLKSPTGYAGGVRRLLVPEHNNESYQWIAQTQQMLAGGEWRIRHVAYDNAPAGRDVLSPSPYRWWMGLVAGFNRFASGRPTGIAVERAALFADPLIHFLMLGGGVIFVARRFGNFAASLLAVGITFLFPLGGAFLPGQPTDLAPGLLCAVWSVLPLLEAIGDQQAPTRRSFIVAGIAGGLGLWVGVARQAPLLVGVAVGAALAAVIAKRDTHDETNAGWRTWGLAGALTSFAAYLVEYFPDQLAGLRLDQVHPLYSLAWLGLGELLARIGELVHGDRAKRALHATIATVAVLVVAAVPVLLWTKGADAFVADKVGATRLTNLTGSPVAPDLLGWLRRDGFTAMAAATLLPVLLLVPAGWLLAQKRIEPRLRAMLALAIGPVLAALAMATIELRWWNLVDGMLLVLLVAITAAWLSRFSSAIVRACYAGAVVLSLMPGVALFVSSVAPRVRETVSPGDVVALLERDLAYWLANRRADAPAVVLAPPNLTTSLYFHGGLAGLGTPYWENKEGFLAAIRIAGATSPDEAHAVAQGRRLNYIVVPSWDGFLDEYARMGSNQPEHSLATMLQRWLPPRWLRPIAYQVPKVSGFEGQSVAVFEVVEVQDNAMALSRLAEYFVEMEQPPQAYAVSQTLERLFPGDLGVAAARAQAQHAAGDAKAFAATLAEIQTLIGNGDDQMLAWDRRVSLAIVLVEAKRFDAARTQVKQCMTELDEARLRSLGTVPLYRLLVMSKGFGLPIADAHLRDLALKLLPAEMRAGL